MFIAKPTISGPCSIAILNYQMVVFMGEIIISHQNSKFLLADGLLKPYKKWVWYDVIQPTDITVVLTTNIDVIEDVTYEQPNYVALIELTWRNLGHFSSHPLGLKSDASDAIHEVTKWVEDSSNATYGFLRSFKNDGQATVSMWMLMDIIPSPNHNNSVLYGPQCFFVGRKLMRTPPNGVWMTIDACQRIITG